MEAAVTRITTPLSIADTNVYSQQGILDMDILDKSKIASVIFKLISYAKTTNGKRFKYLIFSFCLF